MNAIVLSKHIFGLIPEVFNAIDMILSLGKVC